MKLFMVPIEHPFIQGLTEFDLEFIDWSTRFDDPKVLSKFRNTIYDDTFDDYWNEAMEEENAAAVNGGAARAAEQPPGEKSISLEDSSAENAFYSNPGTPDPGDWEDVE